MNPSLLRILPLGLLGTVVALTGAPANPNPHSAKAYWVYFGTYSGPKSKGIYRARLDVATGQLSAAEVAAECQDPAFLALHPNGRVLYAIDERSRPEQIPGRGLRAYQIDSHGTLALLNEQSVGGAGPCHVTVDARGQCVLVANYSGGSVAALPIAADGRLGSVAGFVQHVGSSVNPVRQKEPHAHGTVVSPDNRFALCADLGLDQVLVYKLDAARATLTPADIPFVRLAPGAGPRHLAFHPRGNFVYVISELLCTMSVFRFDPARGTLDLLQTISTLPPGEAMAAGTSTAEVVVHPSGRWLFGSNRGHNTIAVFAIAATTGRLTHVENQPTRGKTPRHFAVDPSGTWLLAENQNSDSVVVFRIDAASGRLQANGQNAAVPSPVSAVFVPVN